MSDELITFEEAIHKNDINLDGFAKDFSKQSFWHYTKGETLSKIFNKQAPDYTFMCNRLDKMNDLQERRSYNSKNVFITCFCNTNSEKIPMWYLYGSLKGNGVAIGITPKNMLTFLKNINYVYAQKDGKCELEKVSLDTVDVRFGWVYYKKTEGEKTKFFYKQKFYEITDFDGKPNDFYFIKSYPWNYEKEFRIVIIDKMNREFDRLFLPIPMNTAKEIRLKLGTNFNLEINGLPFTNKPKPSELEIEMDLLERYKDEVLNFIESEKSTQK